MASKAWENRDTIGSVLKGAALMLGGDRTVAYSDDTPPQVIKVNYIQSLQDLLV